MSDLYVLMEEYLDGTLKGDALKELEMKLSQNPELKEELSLLDKVKRQMALLHAQKLEEDALKQTLSNISSSYFSNEEPDKVSVQDKMPAKVIPLWRRGVVQLVAAMIVLAVTFMLYNSGGQQFDMNSFYEPAISLRQTISEEHPLRKGLEAYKVENYAKVVEILNGIQQNDNRYVVAQYYLGHSYFRLENYNDALKSFDIVLQHQETFFRPAEEVKWSKLLTLIALKQSENADFKELIEELKNSSYSAKIEELVQYDF